MRLLSCVFVCSRAHSSTIVCTRTFTRHACMCVCMCVSACALVRMRASSHSHTRLLRAHPHVPARVHARASIRVRLPARVMFVSAHVPMCALMCTRLIHTLEPNRCLGRELLNLKRRGSRTQALIRRAPPTPTVPKKEGELGRSPDTRCSGCQGELGRCRFPESKLMRSPSQFEMSLTVLESLWSKKVCSQPGASMRPQSFARAS